MKTPVWPALALFLMFSLLPGEAKTQSNGWEEVFFKANQAYKEGRFQEAVDGYSSLLGSGEESGHLYYNLGNAYFRLDRLGPAILNYEKARRVIPRDADLNFNLRLARDQTQDAIVEPRGFIKTAFFWIDSLSLDELLRVFIVLNLFFWAILLIRLFLRAEWTYYLTLILLIAWLLAGLSSGLKGYQEETANRAVILEKEVAILAGPDIQDTVLFKLHEGTRVRHERREEGWRLIALPDGKRGWIKADALGII